jgi:hypothetical protein
MRKSLVSILVVSVALLAAQAGAAVFSTGFDAGYAAGPLWGQGTPAWGSSNYGSTPGGTGDSWLSNPNVVADPTNASNQVANFFGDCSGGTVRLPALMCP